MSLTALSTRPFRHYLIGNAISLHGLWVQKITIGWMAWEATGSIGFLGWLAFLNYAPPLFLGPFFGVIVDRVNIRKAAITTQSLFLFAALALLALHLLQLAGPASLSAVAFFIGLVTSAQHPVRMAITPRLVPASQLASVVLLLSLNFNLARVIGPAIGGAIIATFGITAALAFTVLAFFPFVPILHRLSPRPNLPSPQTSLRTDFSEGFRYVLGSSFIRTATLITGLFSFSGRGALELLPSLAEGSYQRGAAGLGVLTAIQLQVQDHIRGRVMSLWIMVAMGGTAFGALLLGALADAIGLGAALQIFGASTALATISVLIHRRIAKSGESR